LPPAFVASAGGTWRARSLWDLESTLPDHQRLRAREYAARQVAAIQHLIFPLHGL